MAPTTENPAIGLADKIIQGVIYDVAVNAVVAYATAQAPILGLPLISSIFRWVVTQIAKRIYFYLEQYVAFTIIDFQTDAEKDSYLRALAAFKQAHATGDTDAIEKAKQALRARLGNLIHWDGS